jgi:hypothetical protein
MVERGHPFVRTRREARTGRGQLVMRLSVFEANFEMAELTAPMPMNGTPMAQCFQRGVRFE